MEDAKTSQILGSLLEAVKNLTDTVKRLESTFNQKFDSTQKDVNEKHHRLREDLQRAEFRIEDKVDSYQKERSEIDQKQNDRILWLEVRMWTAVGGLTVVMWLLQNGFLNIH